MILTHIYAQLCSNYPHPHTGYYYRYLSAVYYHVLICTSFPPATTINLYYLKISCKTYMKNNKLDF